RYYECISECALRRIHRALLPLGTTVMPSFDGFFADTRSNYSQFHLGKDLAAEVVGAMSTFAASIPCDIIRGASGDSHDWDLDRRSRPFRPAQTRIDPLARNPGRQRLDLLARDQHRLYGPHGCRGAAGLQLQPDERCREDYRLEHLRCRAGRSLSEAL